MEIKQEVKPEEVFDDGQLAQQDAILDGLNSAFGKQKNPTLPEAVFVNLFLPFFAKDENPEHKVTLKDWFAAIVRHSDPSKIDGQAFLSVDIVDTAGKVLFTVPPALDHDAINSISEGETSLKHVVISFQQYNNVHPAQGKVYLETQLARRKLIQHTPVRIIEQLRQWDAIYKRYGRPTLLREEDFAEVKQEEKAPGNDEFSYSSF